MQFVLEKSVEYNFHFADPRPAPSEDEQKPASAASPVPASAGPGGARARDVDTGYIIDTNSGLISLFPVPGLGPRGEDSHLLGR